MGSGTTYHDRMRRRHRTTAFVCAAVLASLISATASQGATRHAAPNGSGPTCSEAVPCSIVTAVEFAANGDEILIAEGEYTLSSSLNASRSNLSISSRPGSAPSLTSGARLKFTAGGLTIFGSGTSVRGLAVISPFGGTTAPLRIYGAGATATRVMAVSVSHPGCDVNAANVRLTYVMCFSFSSHGLAVSLRDGTSTTRVQNVLAISQQAGAQASGIAVEASGTARLDVAIINTVARGGPPEQDITARALDGARSTVAVTSSNYRDRTPGLGTSITAPTAASFNQTADPLLVWGSDFSLRPQAGSPLIDRGSVLAVGATSEDLGGGATPRGGARDIGAYEHDSVLPPVATPGGTMTPPAGSGLPAPAPLATAPATPSATANGDPGPATTLVVTRARVAVQRRAIRVRTRVAVPAAGVVTQRVTTGRGSKLRVLCSARIRSSAAGTIPITCTMRRAARDLLRRSTQRYTITTAFVVGDVRTVSTQRVVAKRRR